MSDGINEDLENDDPDSVDSVDMNNTVLSTFSQGVAIYLNQSIFPLIVQQLATRGVIMTVDELMALVSAPYSSNNNQAISGTAPGGIFPPRKPPTFESRFGYLSTYRIE